MNRRRFSSTLVYALATWSCGDAAGEDPSADTSTSVVDTGTDATTITTSMSDTAPTVTTDDPTLTTSMSMSASESEVTSETDPTTGPTGCVTSDECTDPAAPICDDLVCVACTEASDGDGACESKDPLTPACRDDGECVQCTPANASACGDVTPLCDGGSSSCIGCTYHEQCADTACDMATGACFDDVCVVDVNGGQIANEIGDGCVIRVHAGTYAETLTISGETVALLSEGDGDVYLQGVGGNDSAPALTVTGGANVYVQGLRISGNDGGGVGVAANGGSVWLDRTRVVDNSGGGLTLTGDAYAQIRNSFVGADSDVPALVVDGSTVDIVYATLLGSTGASPALRCVAPDAVNVRNSIVASRAAANEDIECAEASFTTSATEVLVDGIGNVAINSLDLADTTDWFVNYAIGNFELTATGGGLFEGIARWRTAQDGRKPPPWPANDPATDIGGMQLRPADDDTPDYAGADLPP